MQMENPIVIAYMCLNDSDVDISFSGDTYTYIYVIRVWAFHLPVIGFQLVAL